MSEKKPNRIEGMLEKVRKQELLKEADFISREPVKGYIMSPDELCKEMSERTQGKFGRPVKSVYEGYEFVIDRNSSVEQTLQTWKEQACKPWLENKFDPQLLADTLKHKASNTYIDNSADSYHDAAMVDILVTKYPEYTDKLTMLQLLNAFDKCSKSDADSIGKALLQSAKKYINGEENFPPTLINMVSLYEHRDQLLFGLGVGVNSERLMERIEESELEMLKKVQPENLHGLSDTIIYGGSKIADKHKDAGNFSEMFTQEVTSRVSNGKIFTPKIY